MASDEDIPECPECEQCEECVEGAPAWMATFSDLVTLLLTLFVLLYAMSKNDDSKFNSVAGSIRKAFAGNAMKVGETIQLGKSPDDSPTMLESQDPIEPFPIDLLTTEGFLDKREINRESDEDLLVMQQALRDFDLTNSVEISQMSEGIKIFVNDVIFFKKGTVEITNDNVVPVFSKIVKLMREKNWILYVEGHTDRGEMTADRKGDSFALASERAIAVTKSLIKRGVPGESITTVSYGDTRASTKPGINNRKVAFMLRKRDLQTRGKRAKNQ